MQVRTHTHLKEKQLRQPYFFSKWFYCVYRDCPVKQHMVEQYKVYNRNEKAAYVKMAKEQQEQLTFLRSL